MSVFDPICFQRQPIVLTTELVAAILNARAPGVGREELSRRFGLPKDITRKILNGTLAVPETIHKAERAPETISGWYVPKRQWHVLKRLHERYGLILNSYGHREFFERARNREGYVVEVLPANQFSPQRIVRAIDYSFFSRTPIFVATEKTDKGIVAVTTMPPQRYKLQPNGIWTRKGPASPQRPHKRKVFAPSEIQLDLSA